MLDFLIVEERRLRNGTIEIYPDFSTIKYDDLMIKGGDFEAVWNEEVGLWSRKESTVIRLIDKELERVYKEKYEHSPIPVYVRWMWKASTGSIDMWHRYCKNQSRDHYHILDQKIVFTNTIVTKEDYVSHRLPFALEEGDISSYEKCMGTWYDPEEKQKLEWIIGGIIAGDIEKIEKFIVLYGAPGSGKSSFLKYVLQPLFEGYCAPFDSSKVAKGNQFWGESFKDNPLISIQTDGKLSKIEDNSVLNAIVSHEVVELNLKNKSTFPQKMMTTLFLGTNEPVKISDAKSGIIRRLIDVSPSGRLLPPNEYYEEKEKIKHEYGAIAQHCLTVYSKLGPYYYNDYVATEMLAETNDFYNFIETNYDSLKEKDYITAQEGFRRWKEYKAFADIDYKLTYKRFKTELKNYFRTYKADDRDENGAHIRSVYRGFIFEKFKTKIKQEKFIEKASSRWIIFHEQHSLLDDMLADCPANYAVETGEKPLCAWAKCSTKLRDINTRVLHFVQVPYNHVVIDFDIKNERGEKDKELNLAEANKWPRTYAEYSRSGGIHLHYIYNGDTSLLATRIGEDIEVKIRTGDAALRRKLTECNDIPVATIGSLPLKEGGSKRVVDFELYSNEKALRSAIEAHIRNWSSGLAHTTPTINLIGDLINKAYAGGFPYDISDMYITCIDIARQSTNHADDCEKKVNNWFFKSKDSEKLEFVGITKDGKLVFFDIEVFPNLLVICWKYEFSDTCTAMINPSPEEVEEFMSNLRLIGFNNRKYDNHIVYARACGDELIKLYNRSKSIISGAKDGFISMAYNISETDIYDFASSGNKMGLKKYEIKLGKLERKAKKLFDAGDDIKTVSKKIHVSDILVQTWYERRNRPPLSHLELGFDWNKPVPEEHWAEVATYCKNDVYATEDTFHYLIGDYKARCILAAISGLTANATTNTCTTKFIFGNDKNPQGQFIYTDLSTLFPGYIFKNGKSWYRGEDPGEGGYVYAEPGMYYNTVVLDVASMHPSSIEALNLFGDIYTKRFSEIKQARIYIKHGEFDKAREMLDGKLAPYLDNPDDAKALADALKTAINSVYGLTSAPFDNAFKDPRNVDNIVAKRGALFMIDLKHLVQEKGYTVVHIKTDSIKIANADNDIIKFVMDYGKKWGYTFEHESTYERICLVNDAVYIAKYAETDWCEKRYGYIPGNNEKEGGAWTATGAQFQVPYIFKTLFSKEPIEFDDLGETKSVTTALYLDMNEGYPDVSYWEKLRDIRARMNSPVVEARNNFTKKEISMLETNNDISDEELEHRISCGHNFKFVGRVGEFVPIKEGCNGGLLVRKESDDRYSSANGAKGYRWLETDNVRFGNHESDVDMSYYEGIAQKAIDTINKFGNFNDFVEGDIPSEPLPDFMNIPDDIQDEEVPFADSYIVNK